jgi:hypothetical protein
MSDAPDTPATGGSRRRVGSARDVERADVERADVERADVERADVRPRGGAPEEPGDRASG